MSAGGGWEGMNVEVVEQQARLLQQLADQTNNLVQKIDGEIRQLGENWHGDDSKKFVADWDGQHKAALTTSAKLLEAMGTGAQQQAAQQKSTSSQ